MKILIVAATSMEVKMLVDELELVEEKSHILKVYKLGAVSIDILIAGIGTTFTTFHLTHTLQNNTYDLVINTGIAGSLTSELAIGDVVNVVSEEFADLGTEHRKKFLTLFEAGFMDHNEFPFEKGALKCTYPASWDELKNVRGITTNKSHGRVESIDELKEKFSAHVESMEGAAVLYVCNWMGIDCMQIRSVSNYVELRDSSKWDIPLALLNLKDMLLKILTQIAIPVN